MGEQSRQRHRYAWVLWAHVPLSAQMLSVDQLSVQERETPRLCQASLHTSAAPAGHVPSWAAGDWCREDGHV